MAYFINNEVAIDTGASVSLSTATWLLILIGGANHHTMAIDTDVYT